MFWRNFVDPPPGFPRCIFTEEAKVSLKTGAVSDTAVSCVPSVAASWCHYAITQRRAACWLGSYAAPIWLPWTPTATLTLSSKCKSCLVFVNRPGSLQIMFMCSDSASAVYIHLAAFADNVGCGLFHFKY